MQTVNLNLNVPVGYGVDEFIAKIRSYAERLAKKCQAKEEECDYEPNEKTIEAIKEAQAWRKAYDNGEKWAKEQVYDNVDEMMADLMKA